MVELPKWAQDRKTLLNAAEWVRRGDTEVVYEVSMPGSPFKPTLFSSSAEAVEFAKKLFKKVSPTRVWAMRHSRPVGRPHLLHTSGIIWDSIR